MLKRALKTNCTPFETNHKTAIYLNEISLLVTTDYSIFFSFSICLVIVLKCMCHGKLCEHFVYCIYACFDFSKYTYHFFWSSCRQAIAPIVWNKKKKREKFILDISTTTTTTNITFPLAFHTQSEKKWHSE